MTIPIGSLNTDDKKARVTFRRLLLAKQLFLHGINHSKKAGSLNKMIAIHNLHNAVEIVLRAIFLHFEIRSEKELNINFENMLKEINDHPEFKAQDVRLRYRTEMRNLNLERNRVEHHATEPASSAVEESRVFVRRFLMSAYQDYFGCDFETITPVSMIEDEHLKALFEIASSEIAGGNFKKALTLIGAAFGWANAPIGETLPEPDWTLGRFDELRNLADKLQNAFNNISYFNGSGIPIRRGKISAFGDSFPELQRFAKHLEESLKQIQNRSAYYSALLSSGVDFVDLKRFGDCTPIIYCESHSEISPSEKTTRSIVRVHWGDKEPGEEDAVWAYSFAVDVVVQWQILGLGPRVPDSKLSEAQRLLAWGDDVIAT